MRGEGSRHAATDPVEIGGGPLSRAFMGFDGYFLDLSRLAPGEVVLRQDDPVLGPGWRWFRSPISVLHASDPAAVPNLIERAAAHAASGWSVGFLTYEGACAFGPQFAVQTPDWPILAWFALYDRPGEFFRELLPRDHDVEVYDLTSDWNLADYEQAFARVKAALAVGESYQVNLTFRQRFRLDRSPADFFTDRCGVQPPKFATFIQGGDWQVASFSPELMFERTGDRVVTSPMKGTAGVGATRAESAAAARHLAEDPKGRAENIMVVDMVRSDLGSVCETGSIETPQLLHVERHRGLLQMVSSVTGRCAAPTPDLLRALFPAASITGAPKISTMRLIRDIESSPRHIYCGAIGAMGPRRQRFSVGIRTALIRAGTGEFGIGSGVVWDSGAETEYAECLDKRDFLLKPAPRWELVEALSGRSLDDPVKVEAHLDRLSAQAQEFSIAFDRRGLRAELLALPRCFKDARPKVRIALGLDGTWALDIGPSVVAGDSIRAVLAGRPICSGDPNLRLKTTSRAVLDAHLDENPDADEVLLYNEHALLTEFCRGNLLVRLDGGLVTPHPESGALRGLAVAALVGEGRAAYADIPISVLERAEEVWFVNSVVGMVPVEMSPGKPAPRTGSRLPLAI